KGSAYQGSSASCWVPAAISATSRPTGNVPVKSGASIRESATWTISIAAHADAIAAPATRAPIEAERMPAMLAASPNPRPPAPAATAQPEDRGKHCGDEYGDGGSCDDRTRAVAILQHRLEDPERKQRGDDHEGHCDSPRQARVQIGGDADQRSEESDCHRLAG